MPPPWSEKEPAGHAEQIPEDCVAYVPALQGVHVAGPVVPEEAVKPPSDEKEPAAQGPAQADELYPAAPAMK